MIFSGHTISCLGAIVQTERPEQDDPFSSGNLVEAFVMSLTDGRVSGGPGLADGSQKMNLGISTVARLQGLSWGSARIP
jgi:hypothetical protein